MLRHFRSPQIILGEAEHHELSVLAMVGKGHGAAAADDLNYELDRARIVPDEQLPADVVRMGSFVTYRLDNGEPQRLTLVYPVNANDEDRISVLSPIGTALIGLKSGQSIDWISGLGDAQRLTMLSVTAPKED